MRGFGVRVRLGLHSLVFDAAKGPERVSILGSEIIFSNKNVSIGELHVILPKRGAPGLGGARAQTRDAGRSAGDYATGSAATSEARFSARGQIVRRLDWPVSAAELVRNILCREHQLRHGLFDR